jgi:hypothetical protein
MKRITLVTLLILLVDVVLAGYIYYTAQLTVTQTIKEIADLTLNNAVLGNIEERETKTYNKTDIPSLGNIINITTTKAHVYLHLDSEIEFLSTYYSTYNITVKFATVPGGSSHSIGNTACTLTLASPDYSSIDLDVSGTWRFDFEITTTAKSVNSDQPTTVTITVTAEST